MKQSNQESLEQNAKQFLTLEEERLIVVKRKHWVVVVLPLFYTTLISLLFTLGLITLAFSSMPSNFLVISALLTFWVLTLAVCTKIIIDWHFHFYIVTNRKMLEVSYSPLFSYQINDVLLDQVRYTEIDIRMDGILNQLLNMGDVTLTFDRPTHQETFVFSQISLPKETGLLLTAILDKNTTHEAELFWHKEKDKPWQYPFTEQIYPRVL